MLYLYVFFLKDNSHNKFFYGDLTLYN